MFVFISHPSVINSDLFQTRAGYFYNLIETAIKSLIFVP